MSVRRSAILNVMVEAAEKAGRSLVRDFGEVENLQVSRKGPNDFVSNADHKAEKVVREVLEKGRPKYGLMLEEGGEHKGEDGEHRFIVDPLDGTTNFLHGIPHWCVSIALERAGEIVAGVVFDPILNDLFWAEKGLGAQMNNRRLQVAGRTALADSVICSGGADMSAARQLVEKHGASLRDYGSACLDLCYVACGRFDGYFESGLKPWDKAAGVLIVREAKGIVTEIDGGKNTTYGNGVIASNAALHGELVKLIKPAATLKSAS